MFFYLQTATWERTYRPEWANMTVMEWAAQDHMETDYVVHKLVGKGYGSAIDEMDLIIAKELVRQRFIVGLMEEMNESIRRFNIVLGVDEESDRSKRCMVEFGVNERKGMSPVAAGKEGEGGGLRRLEEEKRNHATGKKNSNKHPKVCMCDANSYQIVNVCMLLTDFFCTVFRAISSKKAVRNLTLLQKGTLLIWCYTSSSRHSFKLKRRFSTHTY
jgi:hypothetical protein